MKNTHKESVKLLLLDQLPLSTEEKIKVKENNMLYLTLCIMCFIEKLQFVCLCVCLSSLEINWMVFFVSCSGDIE